METRSRFTSGHETGGVLYGNVGDTGASVSHATVHDPDDEHTSTARDRMSFNLAELAEPGVIGLWHSHSNSYDTQPSDGDLATWRALLDDLERDRLVAVIVATGARFDYAAGRFDASGYLVERQPSGHVTYEFMAVRGL